MSVTFYYSPMSRATRVYWALEELGVPFEKVKLDLTAGDHKKPEYLAKNPNGKVPLLVVDGTPIFESLAILIYLGERWGVEKDLFPALGLARADALKWMVWGEATLGEAAGRVFQNTSDRFPAEQRNQKAGEVARKELDGHLAVLDRELQDKEYLVDGKFSFADLPLVATVRFLTFIGVDLASYANLQAWVARCTARPAMARAMAG